MSVERAVARRRALLCDRIAEAVRAELPGLDVRAGAQGVMIAGRGLGRRRLDDVALRGIAGAVRERVR